MELKFLDVVKWANASPLEKKDVMVVEDIDGKFATVRHINEAKMPVTNVLITSLRKVGKCSSVEPVINIVNRYKNM